MNIESSSDIFITRRIELMILISFIKISHLCLHSPNVYNPFECCAQFSFNNYHRPMNDLFSTQIYRAACFDHILLFRNRFARFQPRNTEHPIAAGRLSPNSRFTPQRRCSTESLITLRTTLVNCSFIKL